MPRIAVLGKLITKTKTPMTLILTVGNFRGVHQSSDYQLSDPNSGAPVSDCAGSKQLQAGFKGLHLQLAFTGTAAVRKGASTERTIDWLSAELNALPHDSPLQHICDSLSRRSALEMSLLGPRGVLTLVLVVATVGRPFRVVVISNARWDERPPRANSNFRVRIHTIQKPFYLISGYREAVALRERHRLAALSRGVCNEPKTILDTLANINAIAARNSGGYVSEGCWVTSTLADGRVRRSSMHNVGPQGGSIPQLFAGVDLWEMIKRDFRAEPGKELRLDTAASAIFGPGDGMPVPPPQGEPRAFTLSGSSVTGPLRSASGDVCGSIEITQLDCIIRAKCNETVTVPFARVQLISVHAACADFPEPLLPWPYLCPALAINGDPIPRGWEYAVGNWIEGGVHHIEIPKSSRGVRSVAFLGDDDEMVIVISGGRFELRSANGLAATIHADISWRNRLDGTRG
jgi:hypothetical protein